MILCCICDSIPLQLPTITFNNNKIKRPSFVKCPGVILNEKSYRNHKK